MFYKLSYVIQLAYTCVNSSYHLFALISFQVVTMVMSIVPLIAYLVTTLLYWISTRTIQM
jgi:hypothetical protein